MSELGQNLLKARKAIKMSRRELSEKTGISERSIQRYENGERNPHPAMLQTMANALGVSTYDLLADGMTKKDLLSESKKEGEVARLYEGIYFNEVYSKDYRQLISDMCDFTDINKNSILENTIDIIKKLPPSDLFEISEHANALYERLIFYQEKEKLKQNIDSDNN